MKKLSKKSSKKLPNNGGFFFTATTALQGRAACPQAAANAAALYI
jgi:hypothetical protein